VCGHQMSGSGTSYFGICRHARHARRVAATLRARGIAGARATMTCG
jgi:4-diphosphocytidyl-2-C-methyl-D-erythritol kinase